MEERFIGLLCSVIWMVGQVGDVYGCVTKCVAQVLKALWVGGAINQRFTIARIVRPRRVKMHDASPGLKGANRWNLFHCLVQHTAPWAGAVYALFGRVCIGTLGCTCEK